MKNKINNIVIFTLDYPYTLGESFLEMEVEVLSKKFDNVYIIPSRKSKIVRETPNNVQVLDIITNTSREIKFSIIIKNLWSILSIFHFSIFNESFPKYIRNWKSFLHYMAIEFNRLKIVERFIVNNNLKNAIFYDYWFVNNTLLLSELVKKRIISVAISRAHGFDVFDERQFEDIVPFRKYKIKYLKKVFVISKEGLNYFRTKIDKKYWPKIELNYLGVKIPEYIEKHNTRDYKLVVSCSRLISSKQIDLIIESLSMLKLKIKWVHFGDGVLMKDLMQLSKTLPQNIKYEFAGEVDNKWILNFYKTTKPDLFISMSVLEGLPVSIMEALSYGIPVVAISVNGIPELVNYENGILVHPKDANKHYVSQKIAEGLSKNWDRKKIVGLHTKTFNGENNYVNFANRIQELAHR